MFFSPQAATSTVLGTALGFCQDNISILCEERSRQLAESEAQLKRGDAGQSVIVMDSDLNRRSHVDWRFSGEGTSIVG